MSHVAKAKMDFLREFPYLLPKDQRIQFLAIAYDADVIIDTYSELFHTITALSEEYEEKPRSEYKDKPQPHLDSARRSLIFRLSWEVIEHADSMSKLMATNGDIFIKTAGFSDLKKYLDEASKLRNKKIHLFNNITNLAKKKKLSYLHGIIKWTHDVVLSKSDVSYQIKFVSVEPITHDFSVDMSRGINDLNFGSDNLILEAFDSMINISRFVLTFNQYVKALESHLADIAKTVPENTTLLKDLTEIHFEPIYVTVTATRNKKGQQ